MSPAFERRGGGEALVGVFLGGLHRASSLRDYYSLSKKEFLVTAKPPG